MQRLTRIILALIVLSCSGCSPRNNDDLMVPIYDPELTGIREPLPPQPPVSQVGEGKGHADHVASAVVHRFPSEPQQEHGGVAHAHGADHWSYYGHSGPGNWGALSSKFAACDKGLLQSPIDLNWSKPFEGGSLELHYGNSPLKIIDNGHTIQANFAPGNYAVIRGVKYELLQVHFHSGSEHTIGGKPFPMEAHLVHKHENGGLAVLGIMLVEGKENAAIDGIWRNLPTHKGQEVVVPGAHLNAKSLLPDSSHYYHYIGSLTTPPCSEGVNWNVLNSPVQVSKKQIDYFRSLYPKNNRPVQALHGRQPVLY